MMHWYIYTIKYQNNFVDTSWLDENSQNYMLSEVAVFGLLGFNL